MPSWITCHVKELRRVNSTVLYDLVTEPMQSEPKLDNTIIVIVGSERVKAKITKMRGTRGPAEFVVDATEIK